MTTGMSTIDEDAPVRENAFREQQERDYEIMFGHELSDDDKDDN